MRGFRELFGTYGANYQNRMDRFLRNEKTRLKFLELFFEDLSVEKLGNALAGTALVPLKTPTPSKGRGPPWGGCPLMKRIAPLRSRCTKSSKRIASGPGDCGKLGREGKRHDGKNASPKAHC